MIRKYIKCNYLTVASFNIFSYTNPIVPRDILYSLTVFIYSGKTLTVYNTLNAFRGKATCSIRPNSGTAYIDFQGTYANLNILGVSMGSTSSSTLLVATNKLFTYGGTVRYSRNIAPMYPNDILTGATTLIHPLGIVEEV